MTTDARNRLARPTTLLLGALALAAACTRATPTETATWSTNATAHRAATGRTFRYQCPAGGSAGSVYGTDTYSDDSSVCTAAVHAGRIAMASGGVVTIEIRGPQSAFAGSTRNGVQSSTWPSWPGSFVLR